MRQGVGSSLESVRAEHPQNQFPDAVRRRVGVALSSECRTRARRLPSPSSESSSLVVVGSSRALGATYTACGSARLARTGAYGRVVEALVDGVVEGLDGVVLHVLSVRVMCAMRAAATRWLYCASCPNRAVSVSGVLCAVNWPTRRHRCASRDRCDSDRRCFWSFKR